MSFLQDSLNQEVIHKKKSMTNGNIRFHNLIDKYASEYISIVGKGQRNLHGNTLTNMIRQLSKEGKKCLMQMDGVWSIMSDSCIWLKFSGGLSERKCMNPVKSSETFVEASSTGYSYWSYDSEEQLFFGTMPKKQT
jgi:hypothetical protein